jgi:hypothetical protein
MLTNGLAIAGEILSKTKNVIVKLINNNLNVSTPVSL